MRCRCVSIAFLGFAVLAASPLMAEVKMQEKTKIEFAGPVGAIMKAFGGKSYRDGIQETVSLKGNRKMTVSGDTAELIDLAEEKVYQIDMKGKSYRVLTFEQMRRQMQEAMDKAKAQSQNPPAKDQPAATTNEPQYEMDFKIQESGQKKVIAGYDAREIIATVTMHEKGKPASEGAFVVTSSMWQAPKIPQLKEIEDFDLKFAQKLLLPFAKDMAEQMAPALGAYPQLIGAMGRIEKTRPRSTKKGFPGGCGSPRTYAAAMYSLVSHIAVDGPMVSM